MDYKFLWPPVFKALPDLLWATGLTMAVSVSAMVLGGAIALLLAIGKRSPYPALRFFCTAWIEIARNTPVLFQLFFFYFGLGAVGLFIGSAAAVIVALSFNTAGYMAETFRGGFEALPKTQLRAARSLGMTTLQAYRHIVIPQVMRIVYLPMTNQFVWVILMSSLGMLVGLRELAGETQFYYSRTFRAFEFFSAAAVIYFVVTKVTLFVAHVIARRWFAREI